MTSARFRLGHGDTASGPWTYGAYDAAIDAAASKYIIADLESTAGVEQISVTIPSADEATMAALPTVTVNQVTKQATFQVDRTTGHTYIVRFTINAGTSSATYKELCVHVACDNGLKLLALGETDQADRVYGWIGKVNAIARAVT